MAADLGISIAEKLLETIGSEIIKEVCDMWGYKSQLDDLKETVSTIRKVLLDAEAKRELSHEEQNYIEKLKDAVYDADDLFDEFLTLAELKQLRLRPLNKHGKLFEKVRCFFSSNNQLGQAYRMSRDVKEIKKKLDAIADSHNKFGFSVDYKPISRRREETCSYVEAKDIIGRDKDKDAIIDMLLDENADEEFCCVTIVGVGGLGKTTLAQLVFNDEKVEKEFSDLRLWVCVSDQDGVQFDVKTILCKILEVVTNRKIDGSSTMELVKNQLQEQLGGKKYLIVLDDVWNEDREKWLNLKKFLTLGQGGSKILVTTRSERTGTIISDEKNLCHLKGLSPENAWLLFELSAFKEGHKDENHDEFVEIGQEIVEKCHNIPLAIKVVGSLLYGQGISKWQSIKESGLANIGKGDNKIMSILKLSYHNLAPSLKSCFSYCALFPKDYELEKETLIGLWMAQGYIMPWDGGQSIEDAAEEHFVILLRRCFFQDVRKDDYGYIKSVQIHDLMHDVAQEVGREEMQVVTSITESLGDKIRHVHYNVRNSCLESPLCSSKIRSFIIGWSRQKNLVVTQINNWKCRRVLQLQRGLGVILPGSIGKLIHLRYLDMSDNYHLEVLPDEITRLHNLQTLLLNSCWKLRELPKDFCKLVNLRHLDLTSCDYLSCMPPGMGKLTSLKILPFFVVGKRVSSEAQSYDGLKALKALGGIRGKMKIKIGENYREVESTNDMGGGYLKSKKHLTKVSIEFDNNKQGRSANPEAVLETLELPPNVKELYIKDFHGTMIPQWGRAVDKWAISLSHLAQISLINCRHMQEMPVLSKLPFLKELTLYDLDNLEYMETSSDTQASELEIFFPSLVDLTIVGLKRLKGWWKGVDDDDHILNRTPLIFPCLSSLQISDCPDLTSFPPFPSLRSLQLLDVNEEFQLMVKTTNLKDDTAGNSQVTAELRRLEINDMRRLKSLPINCLTEFVFVSRDQEVDRILGIDEVFQRCASSLQSLALCKVHNLWGFCGRRGLEHFTALDLLTIDSVIPRLSIKDEDGDDSMLWKSIPQNLRTLELKFLEEVTSLPKGMQYLTSLQTLSLSYCEKLKALPDWIDCLSSLQSLYIESCRDLKSLPEAMRKLTSLQRLQIWGCPDLQNRCTEPDGEDYPKIRHIPHIILP